MDRAPRKPFKKGKVSSGHSRWPLILIGVGKLLKAAGLVFVAVVANHLMNPEKHKALEEWVREWRLTPHNHYVNEFLGKVLSIDPGHLKFLRVGVIVYAVLFAVEGVGLIMDYGWAEWLLVVSTGLLIPVEVWEIFHRPTTGAVVVFVLNVIVMIYVCVRLKWRLQDRRG